MVEVARARTAQAAQSIARRYGRIPVRTEPLGRLVHFLVGTPDPLEKGDRGLLIGRREWESYDTRKRNRTVGFLRRSFLVGRHGLRPPLYYSQTIKNELFDRQHASGADSMKVVFRYKDFPMAAMAPRHTLPVTPLLGLVPRLKSTPTEDLVILLNSRLFHFYWHRWFPRKTSQGAASPVERLERFKVPMLTKKVGAQFREVRDEILTLAAENSQRLLAMDRVSAIAKTAGVPLIPLGQTEAIIREINVPRPIGDVADVKRRGPVVIFRRGSTIVTTTEEAATYLELWLQDRFDRLRGMTREDLEQYIRMPISTAHVVVVLQHRARIEAEFDRTQGRIDELQFEAENRLYDLYRLDDGERVWLRSTFA